jgi:ParB family transcriptional regulator, chromosome partitioning protein
MSLVAIDRVHIPANRRALKDHKVAELMQSIQTNGLLNPVTLDQNYTLIAGLHRLTACRLLGFEQIECTIITCTNHDHARLAEIDENLIRNELEALERAELWLERDQILEKLGLRAKAGDNQYSHRDSPRGDETVSRPIKTTLELANEVGYTDRTFQQGKQIARDIAPEVKQVLKGTPVAKSPRSLLKVARAGGKARQQAEQAERAAQDAKAQQQQAELEQQSRLAAEARAKQKELQLLALQSIAAEKIAKQTVKQTVKQSIKQTAQQTADSISQPEANAVNAVKSAKSARLSLPKAQPGDEWLLDRHLIFCGDPTSNEFIDRLPSNAALAIAASAAPWNHDYLADEAQVVAVIRPEGAVHEFCSHHQMPFRFELLLDRQYIAICSRQPLFKPEHPIEIEGIEGIVSYLISLYTKPNHFVIAPTLGHGEVLIACERMGRICFVGEPEPERINQAIERWQKWTGKLAEKAL